MNYTNFFIIFIVIYTTLRNLEMFLANINKEHQKFHSEWTFYFVIIYYFVIVFSCIVERFLYETYQNYLITLTGIFLLIIRFLIKYWSVKTLNKFWSPHIEIRNDHKLITNGPYKYVRHPAYFSGIIEVAGVTLVANTYYTFLFGIFACTVLVLIRIKFEEKILLKQFSKEYEEYKKNTSKLIPLPIPYTKSILNLWKGTGLSKDRI